MVNRGSSPAALAQARIRRPRQDDGGYTAQGYAELHCISNYSFLRGASHPEELVIQASKLGYAAIAITDECSMAGVVKAHVAAKECNLKLVVGSEFHLDEDIIWYCLPKTASPTDRFVT